MARIHHDLTDVIRAQKIDSGSRGVILLSLVQVLVHIMACSVCQVEGEAGISLGENPVIGLPSTSFSWLLWWSGCRDSMTLNECIYRSLGNPDRCLLGLARHLDPSQEAITQESSEIVR